VNPTIRSLSVLACLAMLPSLTGCAYGTISRVYATSGSDISLTEVRAAGEASAVCEYQKEAYLLIEVATEAASVVEGVVRDQTGMDAREEKPPPPCIAFKIHERVWFDAAESINLQELLREEYGARKRRCSSLQQGFATQPAGLDPRLDGCAFCRAGS